jgi:hypothetical protein
MSHPPYYFFHEYLDEARRFRVHKHTADTEQQARTNHRQAANFQWVTNHTEPTISSLFGKVEGTYKAITPSQRLGTPYRTHTEATPMPDDVRQLIARYTRRTNLYE